MLPKKMQTADLRFVHRVNYNRLYCYRVRVLSKRRVSVAGNRQRLRDNSPTNQLAVSQVADWITRGLVNSQTANF